MLGGKLGLKLFEVKFQQQAEEQTDHTQRLLYEGLHANEVEDWKANMESIARKMVQDAQYEKDVVVTFIRGNYFVPTKRNHDVEEVAKGDEVYKNAFIICSMTRLHCRNGHLSLISMRRS